MVFLCGLRVAGKPVRLVRLVAGMQSENELIELESATGRMGETAKKRLYWFDWFDWLRDGNA